MHEQLEIYLPDEQEELVWQALQVEMPKDQTKWIQKQQAGLVFKTHLTYLIVNNIWDGNADLDDLVIQWPGLKKHIKPARENIQKETPTTTDTDDTADEDEEAGDNE
jgi:hypothetical protein